MIGVISSEARFGPHSIASEMMPWRALRAVLAPSRTPHARSAARAVARGLSAKRERLPTDLSGGAANRVDIPPPEGPGALGGVVAGAADLVGPAGGSAREGELGFDLVPAAGVALAPLDAAETEARARIARRPPAVIDGVGRTGFEISGVFVPSSVIVLPRVWLLWRPRVFDEIDEASLVLFDLLEPAPEVLLVGVGERLQRFLPPEVIDRARSRGIVVEQMDTPNACATFNILSQEKRRVAGAFLTIEPQAYHASELDDL